ncbi:putative glycoside hydrolase [Methanobrevibacter filiformis]|uniref:Pseudomurein-binding repeat protein n=1 Tax=Methanobrevibacter filiformis TaxID=55758 RepID=A0A166DB76_9EURY|nr:putative glycoside hydrolase [Methanobrevibacter filiformis]KZX15402.1 pseudomurein-binding repeat protein [Methanobrevibacter filiformis]
MKFKLTKRKTISFLLLFSLVFFISCGFSFAGTVDDKVSNNNLQSKDDNLKAAGSPKTVKNTYVSQKSVIYASYRVKRYIDTKKKLPSSVKISGKTYNSAEFLYLASKTINAQNKKKLSSKIAIKRGTIKKPSTSSGNLVKGRLTKKTYVTMAKKVAVYGNKYKKMPKSIKFKSKKLSFNNTVYTISCVLHFTKLKKRLPNYVKIASFKPVVTYKVHPKNKYSIWVRGGDMYSIDFNKLKANGIGHIFLNDFAFTSHGKTKTSAWIKEATKRGLKVHIWVQSFNEDDKWINPVNKKTKSYNTIYFSKFYKKIKSYVKVKYVAGIHLDYLRYPGTAYKYNYSNGVSGVNAINKFTKGVFKVVKSENPKLILSAAVMPETNSNIKYYGQDTKTLCKYLDVIVPMIYSGNYGEGRKWITSTSKWFAQNSGSAEVWGGIQTYKGDNDLSKRSILTLSKDSKAVLSGGSEGVAFFRWGLMNFFDLSTLKG